MIEHAVTHHYQPTNNTCGQTALSMLLSHFDDHIGAEEIAAKVPVVKNEKGQDWGTLNQQLAEWCIKRGYDVTMYTADFQIIDLSWSDLAKDELLNRMEAAKTHREVPSLGKMWAEAYMQSYIDFINAGGDLHVIPYMSTKLLDELLTKGPLVACVCLGVLYGRGRRRAIDLRQTEPDDLDGITPTHSIVIYGKDAEGNYQIADPWEKPGRHTVEPECLLAAMTASQIECDNLLFQLSR